MKVTAETVTTVDNVTIVLTRDEAENLFKTAMLVDRGYTVAHDLYLDECRHVLYKIRDNLRRTFRTHDIPEPTL